MADRSVPADPAESTSLTPQPNQILAQPATVEACQQDYEQAPDIRARLGWTDGPR